MKNVFLSPLFCLNLIFAQGIQFFEGSFDDALKKAQLEGKLVFVDAYTTWCGPCKWLANEVFPNEELGDFYNKNFISIQLDMEKGEGIEFARKYSVKGYPTLIYFDENGKEVHRLLGARDAGTLLKLTQEIMDEDNRFSTLKRRVESSDLLDKKELRKYLIASGQQGDIDIHRTKLYLSQMSSDDWRDLEILDLIIGLSEDSEDPNDVFMQGIFENYTTILSALNMYPDLQKFFKRFIDQKLAQSLAKKIDDKKFDNSLAENFLRLNQKTLDKKRIMLMAERTARKNQNNLKKLLRIDHVLLEKYEDNPDILNNSAWEVYTNQDASRKELKYALSWARKSVSLDEKYYNTDTLAHILFRLGRFEEAKIWAERSIDLGKKEGLDVTLTEILLSNILKK